MEEAIHINPTSATTHDSQERANKRLRRISSIDEADCSHWEAFTSSQARSSGTPCIDAASPQPGPSHIPTTQSRRGRPSERATPTRHTRKRKNQSGQGNRADKKPSLTIPYSSQEGACSQQTASSPSTKKVNYNLKCIIYSS